MQYSSSAINPYIYAYRNQDVRNSFKKILSAACCFCCKDDLIVKTGSLPRRQTNENNAYSSSKDCVFDQYNGNGNQCNGNGNQYNGNGNQCNGNGNNSSRVLDNNGKSCKEQTSRKKSNVQFEEQKLMTTAQVKGQEQCYGKSYEGFTYPQLEPQLTKIKHFNKNQEITPSEKHHLAAKTYGEKDTDYTKRARSKSTLDPTQHENKRTDERHFQRKLYEKEQLQQLRDRQKRIIRDQKGEKRFRSQSVLDAQSVNERQRDISHEGLAQTKRYNRHFDNKEIKNADSNEEQRRRRRSYSNREFRESRPKRKSMEKTSSFKYSVPCYENPVDLASEGTYV